ncbi:MAG: hypothetical protein JNL62_07005, partial [Bryobacterales bacterium]|nr:hypothetical protein [Bryobacterales bacterium]
WAVVQVSGSPLSHLIDSHTGVRTPVPSNYSDFAVTDEGVALGVEREGNPNSTPGLWKDGVFTPFPMSQHYRVQALSDDGGLIVYANSVLPQDGSPRIFARRLREGTETPIAQPPSIPPSHVIKAVLSRDSRTLLILSMRFPTETGNALWISDTAAGDSHPVAFPRGENPLAATLSGSGEVAYVSTNRGRIVRLRIVNGVPGELVTVIPETPFINPMNLLIAGSQSLLGAVIPGEQHPHVTMNRRTVPVLSVTPGDRQQEEPLIVAIQTPWELSPGPVEISLDVPNGSPFRQHHLMNVTPFQPYFVRVRGQDERLGQILFLRGDGSLLGREPPRPGEQLSALMAGLGPVNGNARTGVPTPDEADWQIQGSIRCRFDPQEEYAETVSAKLAPGLVGLYEVVFRLPVTSQPTSIQQITCDSQLGAYSMRLIHQR